MKALSRGAGLPTHAFTLIELLVVIAIIGVLSAIMFTGVSLGLERGRQASCQSNLRQIATAVTMYADDHDGYLPTYAAAGGQPPFYTEQLMRYLPHGGAWACPSLSKWNTPSEAWKQGKQGRYLLTVGEGWGLGWPSYGPNVDHVIVPDGNPSTPRRKLAHIPNASAVYAFGEMQAVAGAAPQPQIRCPLEGGAPPFSYQIHGNGNNVLFVDGHVSLIGEARMFQVPTATNDPWNHFGL